MILCVIEFGVKPGMDEVRTKLLAELFVELSTFDGFLGKETYDDCDKPGRRITISYWTDEEALARWMRNRPHVRSIGIGKREVFTHYHIRIAEVQRENSWKAPDRPASATQ
jgi:heme-degrading monooxygenase HmoA